MKTRVLSGLIMAPLLVLLYFGGYPLMIACFAIGIVGLYEFYKGFRAVGARPNYIVGALFTFALYVMYLLQLDDKFWMLWLTLLVACGFISCLYDFTNRTLYDGIATVTGVIYVVYFSFHVVMIDATPHHILVWTVVLSAFGSDIFAYFTGKAIGKHKLCPNLSPKKTIEGSVGGVLGAVALCGLFAFLFAKPYFADSLIIGCFASVVSQFGDLTASSFKRKMGIKDYGNLIPGHGGILDRFDSVLFTAPFVYYYILFFVTVGH